MNSSSTDYRQKTMMALLVATTIGVAGVGRLPCAASAQEHVLHERTIPSRSGAEEQPIVVIEPSNLSSLGPVPLLVSLHSWSGDWSQRNPELEALATQRGWLVLEPNFHGPNRTPLACGSESAQQQIIEAVRWCCENYSIDRRRIYLTGVSGGGHMTMMMAGRYPQLWTAASAWVGISDLEAWHQLHHARGSRYAADMELACGGAPGDSPDIDREYRVRSPRYYLAAANTLPLDIAAGIHDGHSGSVPVSHSLVAFNAIAVSNDEAPLGDEEIAQWCREDRADPTDLPSDKAWGRAIHFRRTSGQARVTLFEGGHEGLAVAAIEFLEQHQSPEPIQFSETTLRPTPFPDDHEPGN